MQEKRLVALDGLRGIAALFVAGPHYLIVCKLHEQTSEAISAAAVEVFFVLSGFVLAPQILYCLKNQSLLPVFFARRWMRTLPPYVLALSVAGIISGNVANLNLLEHLVFVQNLFSIDDKNDFFPVAWSLSVEEWFYVLFPLYLIITKRFGINLVQSISFFLLFFLAVKIVGFALNPERSLTARRLVFYRLDSVCFGFVLFLGLQSAKQRAAVVHWIGGVSALAISIAGMIAALSLMQHESHRGGVLLFVYVAPLLGGSLIVLALACEPFIASLRAVTWMFSWAGRLSYGMYLFHLPIISAMVVFYGNVSLRHAPAYLLALVFACVLIYRFFERPILAARPQYGKSPPSVTRPRAGALVGPEGRLRAVVAANGRYWSVAIIVAAALECAMIIVAEQKIAVKFTYLLF